MMNQLTNIPAQVHRPDVADNDAGTALRFFDDSHRALEQRNEVLSSSAMQTSSTTQSDSTTTQI